MRLLFSTHKETFAIFFICTAIGGNCGKVSFRDNAIAASVDPALSILLGVFLPLPYSVMPYQATLIVSKGFLPRPRPT